MFVTKAPHTEDDRLGIGYRSDAGKFLIALLRDVGFLKEKVYLTHAIRCRPRTNSREIKIDEIRTCRTWLDREIKRTRPRMIVSLGAVPAKALTDDHTASVSKLRGTLGKYNGIPVYYANDPGAVFHDRAVKRYLEEDLRKALEWYRDGCPDTISTDSYQILPWEELPIGRLGWAAIDLETTGFDPYAGKHIMSIAACTSPGTVYYRLVDAPPGSEAWLEVLNPLRRLQGMLFHNGPFDLAWMTAGLKRNHWIYDIPVRDSMVALQLRDEKYPNTSLAHLMNIHAGLPKLPHPKFMEEGFPKGWKTKKNFKELEEYNSRDAWGTWVVERQLKAGFENEKVGRCYDWICEAIPAITRMRHSGIHLSQKKLEKLYTWMSTEIRKVELKLTSHRVDYTKRIALQTHLFTKLRLPVLKKTKTGEPSVDADALEMLLPKDKSGFIENLLKHRQYAKIRDTYCTQMMAWGKIAHPRLFLARQEEGGDAHGANTGRVTTEFFGILPRGEEDPNSPYSAVKRIVTSRYGSEGVIAQWDGSQMELRILADLARDKRMTEAFERDEDIHSFVASQLYDCSLDKVSKPQRQVGKHYGFRTVYGGKSTESAKKAGIIITPEEDQEFQARYFKRFDGVARWIDNQHKIAQRDKILFSPTGRPFHLDNALHEWSKDMRKSTNSPIQEAANAFTQEALKQLIWFIIEEELKAHVILTVYDSIVSDWHKSAWERVKPEFLMTEVLTTRVKDRFRKLGWEIMVPIKWDMKVGPSLGECK